MIKGFVTDDERLKQGKHFGQDYFDELLGRIREIDPQIGCISRRNNLIRFGKLEDAWTFKTNSDPTAGFSPFPPQN
jgi:hypothetical protein